MDRVSRMAAWAGSLALACVMAVLPVRAAEGPSVEDNPHGEFRADCSLCHHSESWTPALVGRDFDHGKFAEPLRGAHQGTPCLLCHVSLEFSENVSTECADCHTDIHAGELGTDCGSCHSEQSFVDRARQRRDHRATRFVLSGAHANVDCDACHTPTEGRAAQYLNLSTDCFSCHRSDYESAVNPNHQEGNFPTDCTACHGTGGWTGASFDHSLTSFALTGAHRTTACTQCHEGDVFAGTPTDCYACHQPEYEVAMDPNHVELGLPTDCASCHSTTDWSGATFDHSLTAFALTGAHRTTSCTDCHVGGVYAGTPTDCYSCHQPEFEGTSDPGHVALGFPTDCASCHSTTDWSGATFDHSLTAFALTGAHRTTSCTDCHVGGVYAGTPTDCYSCHQPEFEGTADPNHVALGFPTDCASCHDTATWSGATVDHAFPIYSGAHRQSRWDSCADCHTDAGNYASFSCFGCHPHSDKSKTDGDHSGEGGYQYLSSACYDCHPNGRS
ncbi:MAG: hypothetical protein DHS20C21_24450 [Gemmatimonadota bacterium]|nr:MAG: hypothetical protein DHS20C21_24450 [Gemmatimonadota bacterium]